MYKNRGVFIQDEQRDQKYKAFRYKEAKITTRLYLYPMGLFALLRFFVGATSMFISGLVCSLSTMFQSESDPPMGLSYLAIRGILWLNAVINCYSIGGAFWITTKRPKMCYKKYLGPDWEPDYDKSKVGTTIVNHMNFLDICLLGALQIPCFISKAEIKNVPFVSRIAIACNNLFIDRSSAESRKLVG